MIMFKIAIFLYFLSFQTKMALTIFISLILIVIVFGGIGFVIWYLITHFNMCSIPVIGDIYASFHTCSRPADKATTAQTNSIQTAADAALQQGKGPKGAIPWAQALSQNTKGSAAYCSVGAKYGYFWFPSGVTKPPSCASGGGIDSSLVLGYISP
jgi:hypothetical protein